MPSEGTGEGGGAKDFLEQLVVQEQARRGTSRHLVEQAQRQIGELHYADARETLQQAVSADPNNQEARRLLDAVGFLLGDRASEIREITRELQTRARVAETQAIADMHMLFEEGVRQLDQGEYDDATKTFERLLTRIHYHEQSSTTPLAFRKRVEQLRAQSRERYQAGRR